MTRNQPRQVFESMTWAPISWPARPPTAGAKPLTRSNLGKMTKSKTKPDAKEALVIVEWVNQEIRNAEKRAQSSGGRTPMRRLNRAEYANTVRDLFHLDEHFAAKIAHELPADGKVDGFDRGGAALFIDKSQLQAYLDMAELVVREALPAEPVKENKFRILALEDSGLLRKSPNKTTTMEEVLNRGDIHFADLLAKRETPLAGCVSADRNRMT